jgi:hypothetical protein
MLEHIAMLILILWTTDSVGNQPLGTAGLYQWSCSRQIVVAACFVPSERMLLHMSAFAVTVLQQLFTVRVCSSCAAPLSTAVECSYGYLERFTGGKCIVALLLLHEV